jgi:hypothetical protein
VGAADELARDDVQGAGVSDTVVSKQLKELEKRLKSEPENLGLRVTVAGLLREAGRSTEAVELYRSVALAYRDQGRKQQAIMVCRSILEIAPDDVGCISLLGQLSPQPAATSSSIPSLPRTQTGQGASQRALSQTTDVGTPPPASSRQPTEAPPPPAAAARLPLEPPARRSSGQTTNPDAGRRSSGDVTPLPKPVPHHIYDPTGRTPRPDIDDLDTNPDAQRPRTISSAGLAEAARKITGLIAPENDVANPMDTRPVRRIRSEELKKLTARISEEDIDTKPHDAVTKPGGDDDDELTTPRDLLDPDDPDHR